MVWVHLFFIFPFPFGKVEDLYRPLLFSFWIQALQLSENSLYFERNSSLKWTNHSLLLLLSLSSSSISLKFLNVTFLGLLDLVEESRPCDDLREALLILVRSSFNYYFILGVIRLLLSELLLVCCPSWLIFFKLPSVPIFRHSFVFSLSFCTCIFSYIFSIISFCCCWSSQSILQ